MAESGGDSIATYACAKASNEDNFVFQKWVRAVLGTNNVDHCARLCHAGSVTGLQLAIGSSAMSNSIAEMEHLDTFIVTGSNTTETHPVISLFLEEGRAPEWRQTHRHRSAPDRADRLRHALAAAEAGYRCRRLPGHGPRHRQRAALFDAEFIAARTEDFDDYIESLEQLHAGMGGGASVACPARTSGQAARMYATPSAPPSTGAWASARARTAPTTPSSLTNLALMTGNVGKPGTGLNPLRGQNNVQGCSDSGGLPTVYTAYQRVDDPEIRGRFERAWHTSLPRSPASP